MLCGIANTSPLTQKTETKGKKRREKRQRKKNVYIVFELGTVSGDFKRGCCSSSWRVIEIRVETRWDKDRLILMDLDQQMEQPFVLIIKRKWQR